MAKNRKQPRYLPNFKVWGLLRPFPSVITAQFVMRKLNRRSAVFYHRDVGFCDSWLLGRVSGPIQRPSTAHAAPLEYYERFGSFHNV